MHKLILFLGLSFLIFGFQPSLDGQINKGDLAISASIVEAMAPEVVQKTMDQSAAKFLQDPRMTSVSIGIYKDGKSYIRHYGELDRGQGNPPTDETIYEIASVSKTMTGALVAQAVLDGKLSLEDDIRNYLKEDFSNLEYKGQPIRIKHMLTHTSRLPGNIPGVTELYNNKSDSTMLIVEKLYQQHNRTKLIEELHQVKLDTFPGIVYTYSNIAPEIIAHILEGIYGKSFDELLQEMLFDKAGMASSCLDLKEADKDRLAPGYNGKDLAMLPFSNVHWGAAGRVKSSMPDLVNYIKFQMDESEPMVKESHRKIMPGNRNVWRAYFWSAIDMGEGLFYSHNGYASGTQNLLRVFPEYNMGISIVSNASFDGLPGIIRGTCFDLVDDLKPIGKKSVERAVKAKFMEDVDQGIDFYNALKKSNPDKYNFDSEEELNNLGYYFLYSETGKKAEAIKVFKLLVAEFPDKANPHDSLGEAFFENEQYELSLQSYQKSVDLDPNNNHGKGMIEKIGKILEER